MWCASTPTLRSDRLRCSRTDRAPDHRLRLQSAALLRVGTIRTEDSRSENRSGRWRTPPSSSKPTKLPEIRDGLLERTGTERDRQFRADALQLLDGHAAVMPPHSALVERECARILLTQDLLSEL